MQKFILNCDCGFGAGWVHSNPIPPWTTLPDTVIFEEGQIIEADMRAQFTVTVTTERGRKHTIDRGLFFAAIGNRFLETF